MKYKNLMAKALYDNLPESPEELAFRKGDILTVLEQNTGGLEGWWLCSLHGRQGIAPGNRLKLLIGPMFDGQPPAAAQTPPLSAAAFQQKVVTPTRVGQSYAYSPGQHSQHDLYDVPPARAQGVYDIPPAKVLGSPYSGQHGSTRPHGVYDIPPSAQTDPRTQGVYDIPPSSQMDPRSQGVYDVPPSGQADPRSQGVYDIPPSSQGVYSVPPCRSPALQCRGSAPSGISSAPSSLSSAPAFQEGNYDFPQPHHKQEGIYDVPPPALTKPCSAPSPQPGYPFPPTPEPSALLHRPPANDNEGVYDVPPPALQHSASGQRDLYDIPRGAQQPPQPRAKTGYDGAPQGLGDVTDGVNRLSFSSTGSTRSSMSTSSSSASTDGRLALDADAAVARLCRQQGALESSVGALQGLAASPGWRTHAFMERHAAEVRPLLERVRAALAEVLALGRGAAANATALSDPALHAKLRRQLGRLEDSQGILLQTQGALEALGWAPRALALPGPAHRHHADDLERFVMVSRTLPDDARQLASTIGGSAELLFRRSPGDGPCSRGGTPDEGVLYPLTSPSSDSDSYGGHTKPFPVSSAQDKANMNSEKCVKSWMEDYDYVHLQGKEDFERQQQELLEKENIIKQSKLPLGQEQINQFRQLEQEVSKPVENDITQWRSQQHAASSSDSSSSPAGSLGGGASLCGRDRQLLAFYSEQCQQHFVTLLNAVDAFFACVAAGQPPRIFVAHSKFVILSAHKLVFIGDTLSRQAAAAEVANRVMDASNVLCELLKTVVGATKAAALRYPSTAAVQEMVDRVTELSHRAQRFDQQLAQMAAL